MKPAPVRAIAAYGDGIFYKSVDGFQGLGAMQKCPRELLRLPRHRPSSTEVRTEDSVLKFARRASPLGLADPQGWNTRNAFAVFVVVGTDKGDPSTPVVVVEMMHGFGRWEKYLQRTKPPLAASALQRRAVTTILKAANGRCCRSLPIETCCHQRRRVAEFWWAPAQVGAQRATAVAGPHSSRPPELPQKRWYPNRATPARAVH
ncbi:hypothetical protein C7974DRAFT_371484 [Boeremia exigua]|uniref:uncharacterized protein n=1 Tax=Boeremia exigua TaxID=749465 RepID=UPI001E8E5F52|nr:uncharacterized protein C7974DRAFT_371484 [Boeremia exigua]KAH6644350.1 hypothetical protein C7974DRAFT_371484 [Boeremia exigua]